MGFQFIEPYDRPGHQLCFDWFGSTPSHLTYATGVDQLVRPSCFTGGSVEAHDSELIVEVVTLFYGVADMPTIDPVPFAIDDSVALHCLQIRHPGIAKLDQTSCWQRSSCLQLWHKACALRLSDYGKGDILCVEKQ